MRAALTLAAALALTGCAAQQAKHKATYDAINSEMAAAARQQPTQAPPQAVTDALLPPLKIEMPKAAGKPIEHRFDLSVNNAPAKEVFMALASGSRYSMLVHPEVSGTISVNLKDVTVPEALEAVREVYGYDYKIDGTRVYIRPLTLQTRVFQVNYLMGTRKGRTDVRVTSGSVSDASQATPTAVAPGVLQPPGGTTGQQIDSSRVTTSTDADFWRDLQSSLKAVVGSEPGRNVVVNAQAGVIVVRAVPAELRAVDSFLKAMQIVVERQVMLEAKIVEVQLRDGFEAGINWSAFQRASNYRMNAGQIQPGTILRPNGTIATGAGAIVADNQGRPTENLGSAVVTDPGSFILSAPRNAAGLFGLALQTANFAALLTFLESQGNVHVLSSPRIATLNNTKAVLKVGTDEFFVTNISTSTTFTGSTTSQSPTITLQPFFSGIALDVTPQIDENNEITLHVHPSVSVVQEKNKSVNLGTLGTFNLPLASSNVNESDTIVRVSDGNIVAIGGLMKQVSTTEKSQVPALGDLPVVGHLFRNTNQVTSKTELVILLKPTVITSDAAWKQDLSETTDRLQGLAPRLPNAVPEAAPPR